MKKPARSLFLLPLLLILSLTGALLASCGSDDDSADSDKLSLGIILPQTGRLSDIGPPSVTAAQMAASEIKLAGGDIELLTRDSGTSGEIAGQAASNLIDIGVDAIVGAAASEVSLSIIDAVVDSGTLMISPATSSPIFTDYNDDGLFFRTATGAGLWAEASAMRISNHGAKSVVIINRDDEWGVKFAESIEEDFQNLGIEILARFDYDKDSSNFESIVSQVAELAPESLILVTFQESEILIKDLIQAGITPQNTKIVTTITSEDFAEKVNPEDSTAVEGIEDLDVAALPDGEATFWSRFRAFAPNETENFYAPFTYDAVVVLALAALEADSTDPEDIAREINGITRDGEKCQLYAECAELIKDGKDIDYDGASGSLEFTDAGEPSTGAFEIFVYDSTGTRISQEVRIVSP